MLANDITLVNGASSKTYKLASLQETTSVRRDEAANLAEPGTLTIVTETKGKGPGKYQRVFARLDKTQPVQTDGTSPVVSAHIVFNVPINNDAAALAEDLRVRLVAFATGANLTSMLNGGK